jgi:hypothetical protein
VSLRSLAASSLHLKDPDRPYLFDLFILFAGQKGGQRIGSKITATISVTIVNGTPILI